MIDLFTEREVKAASKCRTVEEIEQLLKGAAMERIDKQTGQANDLRYMAYRLQYISLTLKGRWS